MAFNYSKIQATASKLLKDFGQTVTITYSTAETYDVAAQKNVKTESTFTGLGVITTFDKLEQSDENITSSDLKLILQSTDIAPKIDNTVTVGGINYRIVSVKPKNPADTVIVYECQLRI